MPLKEKTNRYLIFWMEPLMQLKSRFSVIITFIQCFLVVLLSFFFVRFLRGEGRVPTIGRSLLDLGQFDVEIGLGPLLSIVLWQTADQGKRTAADEPADIGAIELVLGDFPLVLSNQGIVALVDHDGRLLLLTILLLLLMVLVVLLDVRLLLLRLLNVVLLLLVVGRGMGLLANDGCGVFWLGHDDDVLC